MLSLSGLHFLPCSIKLSSSHDTRSSQDIRPLLLGSIMLFSTLNTSEQSRRSLSFVSSEETVEEHLFLCPISIILPFCEVRKVFPCNLSQSASLHDLFGGTIFAAPAFFFWAIPALFVFHGFISHSCLVKPPFIID